MPLLETNWGSWKKLFPDTKILNINTNHNRDYNQYPYGEYRTCSSHSCPDYIYFPIEVRDDRLPAKERVVTIVSDDNALAIKINSYNTPEVIHTTFNDNKYAIVVSGQDNIGIAFQTDKTLEIASWDIENGNITLVEQNSTNRWNILGYALDGNQTNDVLSIANSYIAYWFSVAAFYPDTEILQ